MKKGFTLIELLVVIAIIAILSAIIFPVFARAKNSAYKSADMSHMNSIRTALQLYRADQEAYPPVLLGYASMYDPNQASVVPANLVAGALYPKLVDSLNTLQPAYDRPMNSAVPFNMTVTSAVWPNQYSSLQQFGSTQTVMGCYNGTDQPNVYYTVSGYDVATVPIAGGKTQTELHYTLFWSQNGVAHDPCHPGANGSPANTACNGDGLGCSSDTPRQLGYAVPPETTVVTWDSYFRDPLVNGSIPNEKGDIVLFLGGSARPYPSQVIGTQSWQATP